MRKTLAVLTALVLAAALFGCKPATAKTPSTEPSITQAEAEALLQPVFAAADGVWRSADRSAVESATLAAFALKDAVTRDAEPYARTMDELNRKHPQTTQGGMGDGRYEDGPWILEGLDETLRIAGASTEPVLFGTGWAFVGNEDKATPTQATLFDLISEYLAPSEAESLDAIDYAVEAPNTIVLSYRYAKARTAETTAGTVWTVEYLAEKRDAGWKVVGLKDAAAMLRDRDAAAVAFYEERDRRRRDAEANLPSDAEILKANGGDTVLWKGADYDGRVWAAVSADYKEPWPGGNARKFASAACRGFDGKWSQSKSGTDAGEIQLDKSYPVPDEVVEAMKAAGVVVNDYNVTQ